jgi:hypothetical protein
VATELPIHSQEFLSAFTDFDFCIAPICIEFKEYFEFYIKQRQTGRLSILDNGAFEGSLVDRDEYVKLIETLRPHEVVAPDVLSNKEATLERFREFVDDVLPKLSYRPHVEACPQGSTLQEMVSCYIEMANHPKVDVMGMSYVCHFHEPVVARCLNFPIGEAVRILLFQKLMADGWIVNKPHHLLGLQSPRALHWYKQYPFVRSVDTSFPILCALQDREVTLKTAKPSIRLDYQSEFTPSQLRLAVKNIEYLRVLGTREE